VARPEDSLLPEDHSSFAEFYRSAGPSVLRLAVLLVDDPSTAADVVQEAFVQVLRRWHRLDSPEAYLHRCVVNGSRSILRRRLVRRRAVDRLRPMPPHVDEIHELSDSLSLLTSRQRAAVVLRYYLDLPESAIADALDVRPGTVKSTLHTALSRLRLELKDD
jgi:RNA polymerase sigma-70 factor (sigma-E family)